MPPVRAKPPTETKAALMEQTLAALQVRYRNNPIAAMEYLLNYFTSVDLVMIRDELRKGQ